MAIHTEKFTAISICTGAGMLDLGVDAALCGCLAPILYVEREAFAVAILADAMEKGLMASVPIWSDLDTITSTECSDYIRERLGGRKLDILFGGVPCQPWSNAGKGLGDKDARDLWPETARAIAFYKPWLVFIENVPGITTQPSGFERIDGELRRMGYETASGFWSSAEMGASHERKRFFLMAIDQKGGQQGRYLSGQWWEGTIDIDGRNSELDDPKGATDGRIGINERKVAGEINKSEVPSGELENTEQPIGRSKIECDKIGKSQTERSASGPGRSNTAMGHTEGRNKQLDGEFQEGCEKSVGGSGSHVWKRNVVEPERGGVERHRESGELPTATRKAQNTKEERQRYGNAVGDGREDVGDGKCTRFSQRESEYTNNEQKQSPAFGTSGVLEWHYAPAKNDWAAWKCVAEMDESLMPACDEFTRAGIETAFRRELRGLVAGRNRRERRKNAKLLAAKIVGESIPKEVESEIRGMVDGFSNRAHRLRVIGNGCDPLCAAVAFVSLFTNLWEG